MGCLNCDLCESTQFKRDKCACTHSLDALAVTPALHMISAHFNHISQYHGTCCTCQMWTAGGEAFMAFMVFMVFMVFMAFMVFMVFQERISPVGAILSRQP